MVATRMEDDVEELLDAFADGFSHQRRSPVLHTPDGHGLEHEDVTFLSQDGVPLEGWLIPAAGSDKLVHRLGYDLRNHGLSGAGNGGLSSSGVFEVRDVVGSLAYARSRRDTRGMRIGLFSR